MICEPGEKCSDCPYFREVETDYDIEIRCAKYDYESHNKKDGKINKETKETADKMIESLTKREIRGQLEEIQNFIENEVHTVVCPDNWWIYSNLHDEMEQLMIILKRNEVI